MKTKTIEFFQTDGANETLLAANAQFVTENPGASVVSSTFKYAIPGDHHGRWVGIEVTYEMNPSGS
jgi:hypothetical protein